MQHVIGRAVNIFQMELSCGIGCIVERSQTFGSHGDIGQNIATLAPLDADAVSGATYSSTAIKNAIDAVVQYYNELTEEGSHEQA